MNEQYTKGMEPFYSPFDNFIIKSDPKDEYTVFLEASNEEEDKQKEVVFRKALEEEAESYLAKGIISWDHLHKITGDPKFIIGEPQDVGFKDSKTFVKGKLYKGVDHAESVVKLIRAESKRLGSSIGGYYKKKEPLGKAMGIVKVIWDETAITYKPVNATTMGKVSLIPFGAFSKALAAGAQLNPSLMSGGESITRESMQGVKKDHLQDVMDELAWRLSKGSLKTDDDLKNYLEYKGVPFMYENVKSVLIKKFYEGGKDNGRERKRSA